MLCFGLASKYAPPHGSAMNDVENSHEEQADGYKGGRFNLGQEQGPAFKVFILILK